VNIRPLPFVRALLAAATLAALAAAAPAQTAAAPSVAAVAPAAPVAAADSQAPLPELVIGVGEIRMLPMPGKIKRIALGHFSFASVSTVDNSLMLIGESPGATSLMVWSDKSVQSYRVRVTPAGVNESRKLLEQVLAENKNALTLQEFDSRLVVSGQANRATLEQLGGLTKLIPNLVVNARPERETARSVLFRLHFVEVSKSLLESIGVQWNKDAQGPSIGAQGVAIRDGIYRNLPPATAGNNLLDPSPGFVSANGRNNGFFFGLATSIASRLKFGSSNGDTRILASPELTAVSGGKARLQVGGEVPIPLAGAFGTQTVEFKPYGIIFNIEPVIGANDTITAKVSTELSQIDPTVTVAGIPGFLTRMTSTEISVKSGEMVALSGLVNSELSNAIDKVPGLGSVPVLGRLFRSDDFRNKRTDLVVLLEPEIVTAGQGMAEQVRLRGNDNAAEFEHKVQDATKPISRTPPETTPSPR
jgi:pilus assembly protein CpaC